MWGSSFAGGILAFSGRVSHCAICTFNKLPHPCRFRCEHRETPIQQRSCRAGVAIRGNPWWQTFLKLHREWELVCVSSNPSDVCPHNTYRTFKSALTQIQVNTIRKCESNLTAKVSFSCTGMRHGTAAMLSKYRHVYRCMKCPYFVKS